MRAVLIIKCLFTALPMLIHRKKELNSDDCAYNFQFKCFLKTFYESENEHTFVNVLVFVWLIEDYFISISSTANKEYKQFRVLMEIKVTHLVILIY